MKQNNNWWKKGIIYQIYPRSFLDTNQNGIGDLNGITQKISYLEDLGIDAIWLSPIYPSPDADFGYDVAEYCDIDPRLGTLKDLDNLLEKAHKHSIKIILDLVLNHTSDQHPWFLESRKSKDNPFHDWYLWRDPTSTGKPPNNWRAIFGGSAWEFDKDINQYYYHMFCKEQPDLNWRNPEVRNAMMNVFKFWLERGVDGFRLDVFNMYFKHKDMPDNPVGKCGLRAFDRQRHLYDTSQPEMFPLLKEIREILNSYGDTYVVGETFLADSNQAITYIGDDKLHAGFDYGYANAKWCGESFAIEINKWDELHGETKWPNYFLNNHDTPRSTTRYLNNEDDAKAKVLAMMHLTVRGTPFMYYGEEIGMRDIKLRRNQLLDPVGKRYWPFHKGRDGCRAPMQWNGTKYGGFSDVQPWLPVHEDYYWRNIEKQIADPDSLLNFYKDIIRIRRSHPALHSGSLQLVKNPTKKILSFLREYDNQSILIILNFDDKPIKYAIPNEFQHYKWQVLFMQDKNSDRNIETLAISLKPFETLLLIRKN